MAEMSDTVLSVSDMIERFRHEPSRSREERLRLSGTLTGEGKQPRLWWETGTEKSALREVPTKGADTIIAKYGLLDDSDIKFRDRIAKARPASTGLLDGLFASAESEEDLYEMQRRSNAQLQHDTASRFRSSLRDSCGAGGGGGGGTTGPEPRFNGGRVELSSSLNDMVNMRTSTNSQSGTFGQGFRALLRSELRLDGSRDFEESATDKDWAGTGNSKNTVELSHLPSIQAGLDELLNKLRHDAQELHRKYDDVAGSSANLATGVHTNEQTEKAKNDKQPERTEEDWMRLIDEIERSTFDVAALEARDRDRQEKARKEQDTKLQQVGKFEEQWRQLFPSDVSVSASDPLSLLLAQAPVLDRHQHHQQQHHQQREQEQQQQRQVLQQQQQRQQEREREWELRAHSSNSSQSLIYPQRPHPDDPDSYFHRSDESPWALKRDEGHPDEHWRHKEYREFLKQQREQTQSRPVERPVTGKGKGCWQGFGRFVSTDVMQIPKSPPEPRWVQNLPVALLLAAQQGDPLSPRSVEKATPVVLSELNLPRRLEELEAAEGLLQQQIDQLRSQRTAAASSPTRAVSAAAAPTSPRTPARPTTTTTTTTAAAGTPASPRATTTATATTPRAGVTSTTPTVSPRLSPRRERFSILNGLEDRNVPLHLVLDYSLDRILGSSDDDGRRSGRRGGYGGAGGGGLSDGWSSSSSGFNGRVRLMDPPNREQQVEGNYAAPSAPLGSMPKAKPKSKHATRPIPPVPAADSLFQKEKFLEQMRLKRQAMAQTFKIKQGPPFPTMQ